MPEGTIDRSMKEQSGETGNLMPSPDRPNARAYDGAEGGPPAEFHGEGPQAALSQDELAEMVLNKLNALYQTQNIAEQLDQQTLNEIAEQVVQGYDIDEKSREDWLKNQQEIMNLAMQVLEEREWAGSTVADVKYPMISTAAIQFSARAFPSIIKGREVVKTKIIGKDPEGIKAAQAMRQSRYLNYDILEKMDDWDEMLDKLLTVLPVRGCLFKKCFRNTLNGVNEHELIDPTDLVVNLYAKSIEQAPRVTHKIELTPNQIEERVRAGKFRSVELGEPEVSNEEGKTEKDTSDKDRPHLFLEQHRWWDLDNDGYQEPYIITVHKDRKEVMNITPRFHLEDVHRGEDGEITKIDAINHFIRYIFMESFDGSIYGSGFGSLLYPLNKTSNTLINQLLDAGSLANRQGGFIGKNINLGKQKNLRFQIGEWKVVQHTGDDIKKGILPLPVKEPSSTLFSLLELMLQAGKDLSSTAEVLSGEAPPSNVPATSTLAVVEQALKVLNAIFKRIHRSLKREFKLIRKLNAMYLMQREYMEILDDQQADVTDFLEAGIEIVPVSDEADMTEMQRITKAKALMEVMGQGLDDTKILMRYLEAIGIPNVEELIPAIPKKDEKIQQEWEKLDIEREKMKNERNETDLKRRETDAVVEKIMAQTEEAEANVFQTVAEAYSTLSEAIQNLKLGDKAVEYRDQLGKILEEKAAPKAKAQGEPEKKKTTAAS